MKFGRFRIDFYKAWPHRPWKVDVAGYHIHSYGTVQIEWTSK